jgi:hypothetical protein
MAAADKHDEPFDATGGELRGPTRNAGRRCPGIEDVDGAVQLDRLVSTEVGEDGVVEDAPRLQRLTRSEVEFTGAVVADQQESTSFEVAPTNFDQNRLLAQLRQDACAVLQPAWRSVTSSTISTPSVGDMVDDPGHGHRR